MAWYLFGMDRPMEKTPPAVAIDTVEVVQEFFRENIEEEVAVTLYQPLRGQCDSDPLVTADGSTIDLEKLERGRLKWIALSRDLIDSEDWSYGDKVKVVSGDSEIDGVYEIHDTMNRRWKKRIDILIPPSKTNFGRGCWKNVKIQKITGEDNV